MARSRSSCDRAAASLGAAASRRRHSSIASSRWPVFSRATISRRREFNRLPSIASAACGSDRRRIVPGLPGQGRQVGDRSSVVRLEFGGPFEFPLSLGVLPPRQKDRAQVEVRQVKAFVECQRSLVFGGRLVQSLLRLQGDAQIVMGPPRVGFDLDGLTQVRERLIELMLLRQLVAQEIMGHKVVVSHREHVSVKRNAVAPIADLKPGNGRRDGHRQGRQRGHEVPACESSRHERGDQPRDRDVYPQQGQIGVAVGHLLPAHLHQADHRNQRAQIPKPPQEEVGSPSPVDDREHRHGGQDRERQPGNGQTEVRRGCG